MLGLPRKNLRNQPSITALKAQKDYNTTTQGVSLKDLFSQTLSLTRTRKLCQLNTSPLSLLNHFRETAQSRVKTCMSSSNSYKNQGQRM